MLEFSSYNLQDKQRLADALKSKALDCQSVFMCIGTEKVFSDSLGPRVGTLLNANMVSPAFVYGMSEQNITAENLLYCYNFIKSMHPESKIVVIDAAVGSPEQIGKIQISDGGITPGAATNKNLPSVGDISIVGIVADKSMVDFYTLNSSKDKLVGQIAQFIVDSIFEATKYVS
ncbi:MAG: spore protease YyaC [Clostridiales bacterium]|nr:spore protease YyaC [Clostridiales bacterium]